MNKADIFKTVSTHLLAQMQHSEDESTGNCSYRGKEGLSCAIGCLIPDKLYKPDMEECSVSGLLENNPEVALHLGVETDSDADFLHSLQSIHDDWPCNLWADKLETLNATQILSKDYE